MVGYGQAIKGRVMDEESISKSDRILAAVKRRKAQAEESYSQEEAAKVTVVIFTLGDNYYAMKGEAVKEILPVGKIAYVPGAPEVVLGIINVRGDVESVLDMHRLLGVPSGEPTHASRIIIAVQDTIRSGLLVDSVEDVIDLPTSAIHPPLATLIPSVRAFATGETDYKNNRTILCDVGSLFRKIIV